MIGPFRCRAEPQIPVQLIGHGRRFLGPPYALGPIYLGETVQGPVGPDVHLAHRANRPIPDGLAHQAGPFGGLTLIAHLGGDLMLASGFGNHSRFINRMSQRLFTINVLASFDGGYACNGMDMVRRGDHYRIDVLVLLVQHLAKIFVFFGLRVASERPACTPPVHIAQRHDVLTADGINIAAALAADADAGNVDLLARRNMTRSSQNMPWNNCECRYGCRRSHKVTT